MKKSKLISLIGAVFILALSSCNSQKKDEMILSYYHENIDSFIYVTNNDLLEFSNQQKDFILFVYSDCGCGGETESIIYTFQKYIEQSEKIIYAIGKNDYEKLPVDYKNIYPIYPKDDSKAPFLNFYKESKLIKTISDRKNLSKIDSIKNIMDKYTYQNGYYSLNELTNYNYQGINFYKDDYQTLNLLDTKILGTNITILFTWKECSDCKSLYKYERKLFKDFKNKIYRFEVDYYRKNENKENLWDNKENGFPYLYQFANYRNGKVPTLVNYTKGIKNSMIVYHNDLIIDGIIKESFFEELIDTSYDKEKIDAYEGNKVNEYIYSLF